MLCYTNLCNISQTVREVKRWFEDELVKDVDVLDDTKINISSLAKIVAQTGAKVTSFANFFYKHEVHRRTIVDIGVLRFPDIDHPFFKVRLHVISTTVIVVSQSSSSLCAWPSRTVPP